MRKYCPISSLYRDDCSSSCGWWDATNGCCAIVTIARKSSEVQNEQIDKIL